MILRPGRKTWAPPSTPLGKPRSGAWSLYGVNLESVSRRLLKEFCHRLTA